MTRARLAFAVKALSARVYDAGASAAALAERLNEQIRRVTWWACIRLDRAACAIDADPNPCPGCDAPGGAHVDCDIPQAGRMTRTERLEAFGPGAT